MVVLKKKNTTATDDSELQQIQFDLQILELKHKKEESDYQKERAKLKQRENKLKSNQTNLIENNRKDIFKQILIENQIISKSMNTPSEQHLVNLLDRISALQNDQSYQLTMSLIAKEITLDQYKKQAIQIKNKTTYMDDPWIRAGTGLFIVSAVIVVVLAILIQPEILALLIPCGLISWFIISEGTLNNTANPIAYKIADNETSAHLMHQFARSYEQIIQEKSNPNLTRNTVKPSITKLFGSPQHESSIVEEMNQKPARRMSFSFGSANNELPVVEKTNQRAARSMSI